VTDGLKLTVYHGEHERAGSELLCDALNRIYERHALPTAILLRGVEGFGLRHTLHTQRLLTLSEDLPVVSIAVGARDAIEELLPEVSELVGKGLVTVERAQLLTRDLGAPELDEHLHEETKLTVYCGRAERAGRAPAYRAVVELLHRHGVSGATAFLGLDGLVHGRRERARFFSRNDDVPLMVVSVGDGRTLAKLLPEIAEMLEEPVATLERVTVCKRDGARLWQPPPVTPAAGEGPAVWEKVMVYAGEQARHEGHPLYVQLVRRLREAGAAGATSLRGIWGYSGDHAPRGDRFLSVQRQVPVATIVIDTPERMARWWPIVDELTDEAGLVTAELVPAFRATGPAGSLGGLRPAGGWRLDVK